MPDATRMKLDSRFQRLRKLESKQSNELSRDCFTNERSSWPAAFDANFRAQTMKVSLKPLVVQRTQQSLCVHRENFNADLRSRVTEKGELMISSLECGDRSSI